MVNIEIRLIFFAAKDGEALYSQQKQDWELTVAQIMNSLYKCSFSIMHIIDSLCLEPRTTLNHYAWGSLYIAAMLCLVTQLCLTLCNIMVCSLPGSFVHGISQRKYWSELPFPSPGDLPGQGIEPRSPTLQVDSLPSEPPGKLQGINIFTYFYNVKPFSTRDLLLLCKGEKRKENSKNV